MRRVASLATAAPVTLAALLDLVIVASIDRREGSSGGAATAISLVLAPAAVWAVAGIGGRIAGRRFGIAAAFVYAVLPVVARLLFVGAFVRVYRHEVMPALVGLRSPGWFALGVGVAVSVRVAPRWAAGAAGVVAVVVALAVWADASWTQLYANHFHETTWSPTLVSLLPFACIAAVGLRQPALGAALGGWLAVFVLRGVHRPYDTGGLWLSLAAAMPAAALLLSGLALLVPRLRPAPATAPPPPAGAR